MIDHNNKTLWAKRSFLFCPGNKTEQYQKAVNSLSDLVIFDWEDSVIQENKTSARIETFNWFNDHLNLKNRLAIRVNNIKSIEGLEDILYLSQQPQLPKYIVLPKVESLENLTIISQLLNHFDGEFIVLIESAKGVSEIEQIVSHPKIGAVMIGSLDLSTNLNCENTREALLYVFGEVLVHCTQFDLPLIDSPYFNLTDIGKFERDTKRGKLLGANARAAIHPNQIKTINQVYTPTEKELSNARLVIKTVKTGVGVLNGRMVDIASEKKAGKLIELAEIINMK